MSTIPTPEESGTKILQIYKNRNIRFREILTFQVINGDWMKMGERAEDLLPGLEWLVKQGYLEKKKITGVIAILLLKKGLKSCRFLSLKLSTLD